MPFIVASTACGPSVLEIHRFQGQTRLLKYLVCLYGYKDHNLSSNNSHIEHNVEHCSPCGQWCSLLETSSVSSDLFVDLKYANDEKCQGKLFQWLISTLKNVDFILTYLNELSSL